MKIENREKQNKINNICKVNLWHIAKLNCNKHTYL
jgi:hypothetical protein